MSVITFDSVPITVSEINAKVDKLLTLYENIKGFETNPDEVFNIVQAAKYLNLSVFALRGKIQRGDIPFTKDGRRIFFVKSVLKEWVKNGTKKTARQLEMEAENYLSNRKKAASI